MKIFIYFQKNTFSFFSLKQNELEKNWTSKSIRHFMRIDLSTPESIWALAPKFDPNFDEPQVIQPDLVKWCDIDEMNYVIAWMISTVN